MNRTMVIGLSVLLCLYLAFGLIGYAYACNDCDYPALNDTHFWNATFLLMQGTICTVAANTPLAKNAKRLAALELE